MTDLTTLIAKLEAAKGPDRELDAEIAATFHYVSNMPDWVNNWSGKWEAEKSGRVHLMEDSGNRGPNVFSDSFTDSIDAAVALAERVLPGIMFEHIGQDYMSADNGYKAIGWTVEIINGRHFLGQAQSLPVALVIAILRAKQAEGKL